MTKEGIYVMHLFIGFTRNAPCQLPSLFVNNFSCCRCRGLLQSRRAKREADLNRRFGVFASLVPAAGSIRGALIAQESRTGGIEISGWESC
jgi:hypothetical protein